MVHGTDERIKTIRQTIEALRAGAAFCSRLKPVIESFDGKQYNIKFDEAISALRDEENSVYVSNHYGHIYINYNYKKCYSCRDNYLMYGYSCKKEDFIENQTDTSAVFFSGKKIIAAAMIENINIHREKMLKEAYELETAFNDLDNIKSRLESLKRAWESITGSVPFVLLDTYGIKRYV